MVMVPRACGCSPSARGRTKAGSWNHAASADILLALLIKLVGSSSWVFLLLSGALLDIHILLPNILIFFWFCFSLWRGSFLLLVSRDVSSILLSSLGFCTRVLSALRPSLVRPFEFTCGVLRICSVCCTHAWFVFGVAGKKYALTILGGNLQSITVSSAYCLVRLACCPLHSA